MLSTPKPHSPIWVVRPPSGGFGHHLGGGATASRMPNFVAQTQSTSCQTLAKFLKPNFDYLTFHRTPPMHTNSTLHFSNKIPFLIPPNIMHYAQSNVVRRLYLRVLRKTKRNVEGGRGGIRLQ